MQSLHSECEDTASQPVMWQNSENVQNIEMSALHHSKEANMRRFYGQNKQVIQQDVNKCIYTITSNISYYLFNWEFYKI